MKRISKIILIIALVLCFTSVFTACNKDKEDDGYKLPASQFNNSYVALDSNQANTALNSIKSLSVSSVIPDGCYYNIFGTMTTSSSGFSATSLLDATIGIDSENKTVLSGYVEAKTLGIVSKGNVYIKDGKMYTNVSAMGQTAKFYSSFSESENSPYSAQMFDSYLETVTSLENLDGVTVSTAQTNDGVQYKFTFNASFIELSSEYCIVDSFNDFSIFVSVNNENTITAMKINVDYSFKFTEEYINSLSEEASAYLKGAFPVKTNFEIVSTTKVPTFPDDLDTYMSEEEFDAAAESEEY